ncbi:hypothetical protein ACQPXH_04040 [Nocardia sp. CA-135953]|uniref:hypothetical protein n=1 Tax=Nocardia sp. CA-135953 TaxID=3239978 RepID=UPI003D968EDB
MAAGGYFNHYDDPDEYWDEEPLVPKRSNAAQPVSAPPPVEPKPVPALTESTSPQGEAPFAVANSSATPIRVGSSFASMELDRGCLPIRILIRPQWSRYVAPHEVGAELMAAYRAAVEQRLDQLYASGRRPTPQEISEAAIPDHRIILMVLLETRTWEEYSIASSGMINSGHFQASGQVIFHGQNPVKLTADVSQLLSIEVRNDWAATAQSDRIVDEILWCADQIRSMRPKRIVRGDYSPYTDDDLEYQLDQHRLRLLEERMRDGR